LNKIKVVLADDHSILRSGLKMLLSSERDIEVVEEVANGHAAINACIEHQPNIIIIDISMPDGAGIPAIKKIKNQVPDTEIIVLTMHSDIGWVRSAVTAGASGFIVKQFAETELKRAIRSVLAGQPFIKTNDIEGDYLDGKPIVKKKGKEILSERELEVLKYIAYGYTYQDIAEKLFLSVKSVETYRSRISKKLDLDTRAKMVRYALDNGLISADSYV
jgi:two-component system response regulator NreC